MKMQGGPSFRFDSSGSGLLHGRSGLGLGLGCGFGCGLGCGLDVDLGCGLDVGLGRDCGRGVGDEEMAVEVEVGIRGI